MKKDGATDYKRIGIDFDKCWKSTDEEEVMKKFMNSIDDIVFLTTKNDDSEVQLKENCYDLSSFYHSVADAIEQFKHLYHIVNVTRSWKDEEND
jgi:hypothetical protein